MSHHDRPLVLVVSCGGTISSVRAGNERGATPRLGAAELVTAMPVGDRVRVDTHTFSVVPSSDLTLDDAVELYRYLDGRVSDNSGIVGCVVTHGTDTLEEMAFALDLLWTRPEPVVLTGAMRNASLVGADGGANLAAAVATAVAPTARDRGVLVVANDEIHAAAHVRKSHTSSVATFRSPNLGPVGLVVEQRPVFTASSNRPGAVPAPDGPIATPVALWTASVGDDGRLLAGVAGAGYRGLVIEALGGGHLPSAVASSAALVELVGSMPVVLASRTGAGAVLTATYSGWPGAEVELLDRGLLPAGLFDARKARVLLTLLLATGGSRDQVDRSFAEAVETLTSVGR